MFRRWCAVALTAVAAAVAGAVAGQSSAMAYDIGSLAPTTWAYTNSHDSGASFVDPAGYLPVGRQEPAAGPRFKARLYFTLDLSRFDGKQVHEALLMTRERTAADCAAPAPLEVWRTAPVTSAPTWNTPPAELERLGTPVPAENYACPGYLQLDVRDAIAAARARGDARLSLELRVADAVEGDKLFGRTFHRPSLQFRANAAPSIGNLQLQWQKACGTLAEPVLVPRTSLTLTAVTSAPEPNESNYGQFAHWPADRPDQRTEVPGVGYSGNNVRYELAAGSYPHGTVVAWSARAWDRTDYSEWAPPCYFVIDSLAPVAAPAVTSADYPSDRNWPGYGGEGVPGTFTVDAQGDQDVVRYRLSRPDGFDWYVDAPQPGAPATFVFAPDRSGPSTLYANSIDKAGNAGPRATYEFLVRHTAPEITVEVNGIGVPSVLRLSPTIDGVTSYRYRIGDGAEATVPAAADGSATAEIVFTTAGTQRITVSSFTAAGLAGVAKRDVTVTDAPRVSTSVDGVYGNQAATGVPVTWTFKPGGPNVTAYEFRLAGDTELIRVEPDANGVGTLAWTPTEPGYFQPMVRAVYADGTYSATPLNLSITVTDSRPYVESFLYNPWSPEGGVGVSAPFMIWSDLIDVEVSGFVLKLNDGTEYTVSSDGSTSIMLDLAPDRVGENVLTVRTVYADGSLSPAREWTFLVAG